MADDLVLLTVDAGIARLTLNTTATGNALNPPVAARTPE